MAEASNLLLGEHQRTLDERNRLSIPSDWAAILTAESPELILTKERPGCLALWSAAQWKSHLRESVGLVESKIRAGRLAGRLDEVQRLGRLLSTRHAEVSLGGRGRLLPPEGHRQFLGVEPGGEVMLIGSAVAVEIWNPQVWVAYVGEEMPNFRELLDRLAD